MMKIKGKMSSNLFTVEEHQTYYIYTVIIDVDKIGKNEVYLLKREKDKWEVEVEEDGTDEKVEYIIKIKKGDETVKGDFKVKRSNNTIEITKFEFNNDFYLFNQTLVKRDEKVKERISQLIKAILYLNRSIRARNELLHPKLLIVGFYNGTPYQSYKDRIMLTDQYEEIFEEKKETTKEDNEIRVVRRIVKLRKPVFLLKYNETKNNLVVKPIEEAENILIRNGDKENNELSQFLTSNHNASSKLHIFKSPEVEVRFSN